MDRKNGRRPTSEEFDAEVRRELRSGPYALQLAKAFVLRERVNTRLQEALLTLGATQQNVAERLGTEVQPSSWYLQQQRFLQELVEDREHHLLFEPQTPASPHAHKVIPWYAYEGPVWFENALVASASQACKLLKKSGLERYECYGSQSGELELNADHILENAFEHLFDKGAVEKVPQDASVLAHYDEGAKLSLQRLLQHWTKNHPTPTWIWDDTIHIDLRAEKST